MKAKNLIIFFVPPEKIVNGGVMSVFSQCKETRRFYKLHHSEVLLCTYPGFNTYEHNDLFENDEKVYSFDQIVKTWGPPEKLLLHIPETAIIRVSKVLQTSYTSYLKNAKSIHVNVMTQNIDLLPTVANFADLFLITPKVTQTTAHERYSTQSLSDKYQTPVHHLSVFVDKSQYGSIAYKDKENLIIYSPDNDPHKVKVLANLEKTLKNFEIREIKNLTYGNYKSLIAKTKFCITFGEGFDGYLVEGFLPL